MHIRRSRLLSLCAVFCILIESVYPKPTPQLVKGEVYCDFSCVWTFVLRGHSRTHANELLVHALFLKRKVQVLASSPGPTQLSMLHAETLKAGWGLGGGYAGSWVYGTSVPLCVNAHAIRDVQTINSVHLRLRWNVCVQREWLRSIILRQIDREIKFYFVNRKCCIYIVL